MKEVSIILPTLNESDNIRRVIESIFSSQPAEYNYQVIVVDSNSTDGTVSIITELRKRYPITLVQYSHRGLSPAIIEGAKQARTEWVIVMDADGSHPAEAIPELIEKSKNNNDIIIGSRHCQGGKISGWPLFRKLLSRCGTMLSSILTDVSDPLSGFFMVRREQLLINGEKAQGYKILLELLSRGKNNGSVREVPIHFQERHSGQSKMSLRVQWQFINQLVQLYFTKFWIIDNFVVTGILFLAFLLDLFVSRSLFLRGLLPYYMSQLSGFAFFFIMLFIFGNQSTNFHRIIQQRFNTMPLALFFVAILYSIRVAIMELWLNWYSSAFSTSIVFGNLATFLLALLFFFLIQLVPIRTFWNIQKRRAGTRQIMLFILIIFCLKLLYLPIIDLIPQEALHWNRAMHLAPAYVDHPGGVAALIRLSTFFLGNSEFGVRFSAFICGLITSFFVYGIGYRLTGDKLTGYYSMLVFNLCPFFWGIGFFPFPDTPLIMACAGAVYYFLRAILEEKLLYYLLTGIMTGLAIWSKYTTVVLIFSMGLYLIGTRHGWKILFSKATIFLSGSTLLTIVPLLIFEYGRDWQTFRYQFLRRMSHKMWGFPSFIGSMMGEITPVLLILILVIAGVIVRHWKTTGKGERWLVIAGLPLLVLFALYSQWNRVKFSWPAPAFVSLIPLTIAFLHKNPQRYVTLHKASVHCLLVFFVIIILLPAIVISIPMSGKLFSPLMNTVSWSGLGKDIGIIQKQLMQETGKQPLLVGMDKYFIAAELSYYLKQPDPDSITSRNAIGNDGLTWNEWTNLGILRGRPALLISQKVETIIDPELENYFERLSPLMTIEVKSGIQKQLLFIRYGYNYL